MIGIDIEIRPHNRQAIEAPPLSPLITLVEGDSVAPETVRKVHSLVKPGEVVMVFLDSCHTKQHVLAELEAYHDLVTPGSYIVATDGIMKDLYDVPHGKLNGLGITRRLRRLSLWPSILSLCWNSHPGPLTKASCPPMSPIGLGRGYEGYNDTEENAMIRIYAKELTKSEVVAIKRCQRWVRECIAKRDELAALRPTL